MLPKFWLGVVSYSHVKLGVAGGFAQVCHGKRAPLARMKAGDWLIYYSPKTDMHAGEPLQMFTAIGRMVGAAPYPFQMSPDFTPHRVDMAFVPCQAAPIRPLLTQLSFITDLTHWGYPFRRGHFEISPADFGLIAQAMGVEHEPI
ncbi:MAG: EVE domain-containing protein [Formosimonas sp.]